MAGVHHVQCFSVVRRDGTLEVERGSTWGDKDRAVSEPITVNRVVSSGWPCGNVKKCTLFRRASEIVGILLVHMMGTR